MDQRITIQGALRKVLFRDECTGYTIFTVLPSDPENTENVHETYGTVTCEATLPLYTPNIPLCMKGKWVTKGKGPVFHVEEYREESRDRRQAAAFLTKLRCGVTAPDADYLTDDLLHRAWALLREALEAAGSGPERERVERETLSVRYTLLAREDPASPGHAEAVDCFLTDAKRLGITELFERKDLEDSAETLRVSRYTQDRGRVRAISYPI